MSRNDQLTTRAIARINSMWKRASLFLILLVFSGCHEKITNGSQSTYVFAPWVGITEIIACLLLVAVSYIFRRRLWYFWYLGVILGLLLLVMFPASAFRDRVIVDDQHFETTSGFWFYPTYHNLRFDDLQSIHYTFVFKRQNIRHYELRCTKKSGENETVHVNDIVSPATEEIIDRAEERGVMILDHFVE